MADETRNQKRPVVLESIDVLIRDFKRDYVTNIALDEKVQEAVNDKILCATTAEWNAKASYVPPKGTIVIYSDYASTGNADIPNFKVGDGNAYLIDLPFSQDDLRSLIAAHIADTSAHLSTNDRTKLEDSVRAVARQQPSGDFTLVLSTD